MILAHYDYFRALFAGAYAYELNDLLERMLVFLDEVALICGK